MDYKTDAVSSEPFLFGETPLWDHREGALYMVDCFAPSIARYDPLTQEMERRQVHSPSGGPLHYICWYMPCQKGQFVVSTSEGQLVQFDWEGKKTTEILLDLKTTVENGALKSFNDAKCDPLGRLWFSTVQFESLTNLKAATDKGSVHYLPSGEGGGGHEMRTLNSGYDIPNGLGWNKEFDKFYHVDLQKRLINVYDFDVNAATLGNRKTFFDYKEHPQLENSFPDGMTLDLDGNLYVASWKGSGFIKIDSQTGKMVDKVPLPVTNTTSVCFGGRDFSSLYLTTTSIELDQTAKYGHEPDAGKLFRITNPKDNRFKGFPQHFYNV